MITWKSIVISLCAPTVTSIPCVICSFFNNLTSPIDDKDLGDCLILKAKQENGVILIDLEDKCY